MSFCWEPDDVVAVVTKIAETFGEEGLAVIDAALHETAVVCGREFRKRDFPYSDLEHFARHFTSSDIDDCYVEQCTSEELIMISTRCKVYEAFKALQATEIGYRFKCAQDFALIEGYNPEYRLTIMRCLMWGDSHCQHHYTRSAKEVTE